MDQLSPLQLAYCAVVLLLAYGLRGSAGFGGAVGMPLLALVVPIKLLVPVWTLLGAISSITILGRDRRHVAVRDFVAFLPWCLIGVALGLWVFATVDARTLARALGVAVLIYAAHAAWKLARPAATARRAHPAVAPVAGALSGAVGATFGTMGTIFFAIYLDARAVAKDAFRATMSAMLLALSVSRGIGYYAVGEFDLDVLMATAAAIPLMLIGIWAGDRIHVRLSEAVFRRLVIVLLGLCGVALMLK